MASSARIGACLERAGVHQHLSDVCELAGRTNLEVKDDHGIPEEPMSLAER